MTPEKVLEMLLVCYDAMRGESTPCPCCHVRVDMRDEPHADYCPLGEVAQMLKDRDKQREEEALDLYRSER